ncbi:MAG: indolepyruvate oxidoreductase subunit beta [Clostridia bacterium]
MSNVTSILLCGVGGQGAILVSRALTAGLIGAGYDVKMSEVHGMAQRGGSVSTQVRFGKKVYSPIIGRGEADILVAFEKMEAVRYAQFLKPSGKAIINDYVILPMSVASGATQYPDGCIDSMQAAFECKTLPAADIAIGLGNAKCMNVVLLGALTKALSLSGIDWHSILAQLLPAKLVEMNAKAFETGYNY